MIVVFFLASFVASRDKNTLTLYHSCSSSQYFDWYDYSCKPCLVDGFSSENGDEQCLQLCTDQYVLVNSTDGAKSCVTSCDENSQHLGYCVNPGISRKIESYIFTGSSMHFHDVRTNSDKLEERTFSMSPEFKEHLLSSAKLCAADGQNQKECQFLANACTASHFEAESTPCTLLREILPGTGYIDDFYTDWPSDAIFYQYSQSFNHIKAQRLVLSEFNYDSILRFYLAEYSYDGTFQGFVELEDQLNFCSMKNDQSVLWREFGKSLYSECSVNVTEQIDTRRSGFYELYVVDSNIGRGSLRPIPVLVKNYRKSGEAVNIDDNTDSYQIFRRFFVYDPNSTKDVYQIAKSISLRIELKRDDKRLINVPYVTVEYEQRLANSEIELEYDFSVIYSMDPGDFWTLFLALGIVIIILALAFVVFSACLTIRTDVSDGMNNHTICKIVCYLFMSLGVSGFLLVFIMTFYILCAYKWTSHPVFWLQDESEYKAIYVVVYISLAFVVIGAIMRVILQTNTDFFVVDWLESSNEMMKSAFSRCVAIANEWYKLTTVRSYNLQFVVFLVLFILEGLNCKTQSSPIPTSERIESVKPYKLLTFAFTSFIWLMATFVLWIIRMIYRKHVSNPFTAFEDLCRALNVSVVMKSCNTRGFYVHGRNKRTEPETIEEADDSLEIPDPEDRSENKEKPKLSDQERKRMLKRKRKEGRRLAKIPLNVPHEEIQQMPRMHKKSSKRVASKQEIDDSDLKLKEEKWSAFENDFKCAISDSDSEKPVNIRASDLKNDDIKDEPDAMDMDIEISPSLSEVQIASEQEISSKSPIEEPEDSHRPKAEEDEHELPNIKEDSVDSPAKVEEDDPDIEIETDSWDHDEVDSLLSYEEEEEEEELMEESVREQMIIEQDEIALIEPLSKSNNAPVFELFIEPEYFFHTKRFTNALEKQIMASTRKDLYDPKAPSSHEIIQMLNDIWQRFLYRSKSVFRYVTIPLTSGQKLTGVGPPVTEDSIFVARESGAYKNIFIHGIEGTLMLLYLLVFVCVEMWTQSPAIGGIIVSVIDLVIIKVFKTRCKTTLGKRKLLIV